MSFFCAGSQAGRKKREMSTSNGSRAPVPRTNPQHNGVAAHPPPLPPHPLPSESPLLSHASSIDLPQTRKMVVLLDYSSDDPSCLAIKRGESVQVVRHEGDMALVRNERGKEGFIPKANLIAPYSNRRQARGSVGSKSSLLCDSEAGDPSHRPIPMFHVASGNSLLSQRSPPVVEGGGGGKSSNRASLEAESASSPPPPGVGLGTSPESNGASSSSEVVQKHSPSSSSGVASSVGSHHPHHHHHDYQVHNGAAVQEQRSSFSSLEDDVLVGGGQPPPPPLPPNPHRTRTSPLVSVAGLEKRNANTSSDETISRGTNSPSLSAGGSSALHRPLPPPPTVTTASSFQAQRSDSPRNSNNGRVIRESEQTPPPVPPRDVFVIKAPGPREGEYSSPADALHPNASHQERLAHYQRERGGSKGGGGEGGVRVRSSTMYRTMPYNRQTPPTSGVNFEVDYLPPRDAPEAQTRRPAQTGRRRFSEDQEAMREKAYTDGSTPASSVNGDVFLSNQGKVSKFKKCLWGLFVVTVEFAAGDENEISVSKGEHVSVWNRDDPDWFWVVRHTTGSEEGFVPSRCLHEMATNDAKHTPALESLSDDVPRLDPPPVRTRAPTTASHTVGPHRNSSSSSSRQSSVHRGRLNSDGSMHKAAGKMESSNSSIDRIPVQTPPSPPPPYTEYDSGSHRGGSLSQGEYLSQPLNLPMSRTHSQGNASGRHRNRISGNGGDHHHHRSRDAGRERENRDSGRLVGVDGPMIPDGTLV